MIVYARSGSSRAVLAPVVAFDPHSALEVGLSPIVRDFVAELQLKDRLTRDHVVRCASLSIDLAISVGLPPAQVREAVWSACSTTWESSRFPDEILKKPGRITPEEFAVMETHTTRGYRLLSEAEGLDSLAPGVRSHHERIDVRLSRRTGRTGDSSGCAPRFGLRRLRRDDDRSPVPPRHDGRRCTCDAAALLLLWLYYGRRSFFRRGAHEGAERSPRTKYELPERHGGDRLSR